MRKTWDDYIGWEVSNGSLARLDQQRFLLNADLANLMDQIDESFPSRTTIKRIQKRLSDSRRLQKEARARTTFDRILKRDIISNMDVVQAYLSYQFFWDKDAKDRSSIDDLLDRIYEQTGMIGFLKNLAHRLDHGGQDRIYLLSRSINSYQYPTTYSAVKRKLDRYKKKVPGLIRRFLSEAGLDDTKDLDINVIFAEGSSAGEYHNDLFIMKLDPDQLSYYKDKDGSINVQRGVFLLTAAHEAGHMLNDRFGPLILNKGAQYHAETYQSLTHDVMIEGLARWTETVGVKWLKEHQADLNLTDKEIEVAELKVKAEISALAMSALYTVLCFQEAEGRLASADEEMARITGFSSAGRDGSGIYEELSLEDMLYHLNAALGFHHIDTLMRRVEKHVRREYEHGAQYVKDHWGLLARGLYIGQWRPKTHERFVIDEYIPRVIEYIQNELE